MAVALIVDSSGSMGGNDPTDQRLAAAKAYLAASDPTDEVAIVDFDGSAVIRAEAVQVGTHRTDLVGAIEQIDSFGGTDLGRGLDAGCAVLGRATAKNRAALFFTDGNGSYTDQSACFAAAGWKVYTFGLGSSVDANLLQTIADDTGGAFVHLDTASSNLICDFQQVRNAVAGLPVSACDQTGTIQQDQTVRFSEAILTPLRQITFTNVWPGSDIEMTVTSPSGASFDRNTVHPNVSVQVGPTHEIITVRQPELGNWSIELLGTDIPGTTEPFSFSTVPIEAGPFDGYWLAEADGQLHGFGDAAGYVSSGKMTVSVATDARGAGVWVLNDDGTVSVRGGARHYGDVCVGCLESGETPSTISVSPSGDGYWVFTDRGRAIVFGAATHHSDLVDLGLSDVLAGPIIASAVTPSGLGYYMVGSDGGVFTFGDAQFAGSVPQVIPLHLLDAPLVGIAPDPDGTGYWLVSADGGIFSFAAPFIGSIPGVLPAGSKLAQPAVGAIAYADGYLIVAADGGIFNFSSQAFLGSLGGNPPDTPVRGIAAASFTPPPPNPAPQPVQVWDFTAGPDGDSIVVNDVSAAVETTFNPARDLTDSFTVTAIARLDSTAQRGMLIGSFLADKFRWYIGSDQGGHPLIGLGHLQYAHQSATFPTNTWFHYATTFDHTTGTVSFYINGIHVGQTTTDPRGTEILDRVVPIGANWSEKTSEHKNINPWQGAIDTIAIYDQTLTPAEIADLAAASGR